MTEREALKLALEALECLQPCAWDVNAGIGADADRAIIAIKQALAQPEQDTCKGCNGNGVVGNILDTVPCPFCEGSGIELQQSNEQVEPCPDKERTEYVCKNRHQCWEPCGELGKSEEHVKVYEQVEPISKDQWWAKELEGFWGDSDYVVTLDTRRAALTALSVIFNKPPSVWSWYWKELLEENESLRKQTQQQCYCGDITSLGVIHRDDGPCHYPSHIDPVVAAARVLNKRMADTCQVDEEDSWKVYGDAYIEDARAALKAAHGIKE